MSSNVFELVLELLAIDPIRRSAIGALLRTGGGREWQRRVGYQTFVKASGNTRLLRIPAVRCVVDRDSIPNGRGSRRAHQAVWPAE